MDLTTAAGLSGLPLFRGLAPRELWREATLLGSRRRATAAGATVVEAGDRYERLHLLTAGSLEAIVEGADGRALRVAVLRAPDAVAPAIVFAPDRRIPVTLTARSTCEFLVVERRAVLGLCARNPRFLENLLALLGARIQSLGAALRAARWATLRARLAGYLLEQAAEAESERFTLPHTREQIGLLLGAERPSVSRSLSALAADGLVELRGREVLIRDEAGLRRELAP